MTITINHTQDCEDLMLGRAIRDGYSLADIADLADITAAYRAAEPCCSGCQCARLELGRIEGELKRARQAQRHCYSQDTEWEIQELIAHRVALRAAIAEGL